MLILGYIIIKALCQRTVTNPDKTFDSCENFNKAPMVGKYVVFFLFLCSLDVNKKPFLGLFSHRVVKSCMSL